jgi:hypothetical protein
MTNFKLYELYQKYKNLENFYYNMYIESYKTLIFKEQKYDFFRLYISFKSLCRLLIRIKNLIKEPFETSDTFDEEYVISDCLLGSEEMNLLLSYKDIKMYLDSNNLHSLIECNHDSFKECINPVDINSSTLNLLTTSNKVDIKHDTRVL